MHSIDTQQILAARPPKRAVTFERPYSWIFEREPDAGGALREIATVFLTNRECPFRCVMCDLWMNTTDERVPPGAIPRQIDFALERVPPADWIKLYNSGNFFDAQAVPPQDFPAIIERLEQFERVIVENHPKLCGRRCIEFHRDLGGDLEVALGLESADPLVLERLNKNMTREDFRRAAGLMRDHGIHVRCFILVQPPFVSATRAFDVALQSIEFAFACGVQCCSLIPTRGGNGIMEQLTQLGAFTPPTIRLLEDVFAAALRTATEGQRVFLDLWDVDRWSTCVRCQSRRTARLARMNRMQRIFPEVPCSCTSRSCSEPVP